MKYLLIISLYIISTQGYPFFNNPTEELGEKEKARDLDSDSLHRVGDNSLDNLNKLTDKEDVDEKDRIVSTQSIPTTTIPKEMDLDKKKMHEEDVTIEEISSEIHGPHEPPSKEKVQVKPEIQHDPKKLDIPNDGVRPKDDDTLRSNNNHAPKVDNELDTANKTVEDLTKLIDPVVVKQRNEEVLDEIVVDKEKFEPEISETATDLFPIDKLHLNTQISKSDHQIDTIPQIVMTEGTPTTTMETLTATSTTKLHKLNMKLSTTSSTTTILPTTQPTIRPVDNNYKENPNPRPDFGKTSEREDSELVVDDTKQEITIWEKIVIGLRCSMRDCRDALMPTEPYLREISAPTMTRKVRDHEAIICTCRTPMTHVGQS